MRNSIIAFALSFSVCALAAGIKLDPGNKIDIVCLASGTANTTITGPYKRDSAFLLSVLNSNVVLYQNDAGLAQLPSGSLVLVNLKQGDTVSCSSTAGAGEVHMTAAQN